MSVRPSQHHSPTLRSSGSLSVSAILAEGIASPPTTSSLVAGQRAGSHVSLPDAAAPESDVFGLSGVPASRSYDVSQFTGLYRRGALPRSSSAMGGTAECGSHSSLQTSQTLQTLQTVQSPLPSVDAAAQQRLVTEWAREYTASVRELHACVWNLYAMLDDQVNRSMR